MPDRQPRVDVLLDDAQDQRFDALAEIEEVIERLNRRRVVPLQTMRDLLAARALLLEQDGTFRELRRHRDQFMRRATREAAVRERAWDGSFDRREADRRRGDRRGPAPELGIAA